jgi:hypothetical protein
MYFNDSTITLFTFWGIGKKSFFDIENQNWQDLKG